MKIKESCLDALQAQAAESLQDPADTLLGNRPDDPMLRASEVARLTTLDLATIKRLVAADRFPTPVRLSERRYAWRSSAVHEWMADPNGYTIF